VSAFLTAWRSVFDVMLYDFDEFYNLGFTREVEMNEKEFRAVAKALRNQDALRFIQWWQHEQGMLRNTPLWTKRNINFHRGGLNVQYTSVVSGSGGTSSAISVVSTVPLPAGSTLNTLVPQPTPATTTTTDWYFTDFPYLTVIQMCTRAYTEMERIVQEAEREFRVQL
jgi:hypothetical protein